MPMEPLGAPFREKIDQSFFRAKADAGSITNNVSLIYEEDPLNAGPFRSEIVVIGQNGPVRITWNAVISIWLVSQGFARLSRRIFDSRRLGRNKLVIAEDSELSVGLNCLVMAHRFKFATLDESSSGLAHWPNWLPPLDPHAVAGCDTWVGNQLFEASLCWIFRHELAHLVFGHNSIETFNDDSSRDLERGADAKATEWLRGGLSADEGRAAGAKPPATEQQLESRAIAIGVALLWVAFMEVGRANTNTSHPAVADRIYTCFDNLGLREDSGAKEVLADLVKLWIDPEKQWETAQVSDHSLSDALVALQRHLANPPEGPPAIGL